MKRIISQHMFQRNYPYFFEIFSSSYLIELEKTWDMVFACKKCKKVFRKDMRWEGFLTVPVRGGGSVSCWRYELLDICKVYCVQDIYPPSSLINSFAYPVSLLLWERGIFVLRFQSLYTSTLRMVSSFWKRFAWHYFRRSTIGISTTNTPILYEYLCNSDVACPTHPFNKRS